MAWRGTLDRLQTFSQEACSPCRRPRYKFEFESELQLEGAATTYSPEEDTRCFLGRWLLWWKFLLLAAARGRERATLWQLASTHRMHWALPHTLRQALLLCFLGLGLGFRVARPA